MRVLLVSTYELGHQPFGLASPAAWLRDAGFDVRVVDVSREPFNDGAVIDVDLVAFHLPMHTATRLAGPLISRTRALNQAAHVCAYGLYAPLNASWLRGLGVQSVLGPEFEGELLALARAIRDSASISSDETRRGPLPRLAFVTPDRGLLPPLSRYAALVAPDGTRAVAGYTEASRGCKHSCRHCPIVPVYKGTLRVVPVDVVMADVRQQVAAGARHITFGDADFFNAIGHARAVLSAFGREFPGVGYDVTIKVEHLRRYADELPRLRDTGCVFVTTAVESIDDDVLARLSKGHTRADVQAVLEACRAAEVAVAPTFVPFTPWTTLAGYAELLDFVARWDLIECVAPVQLGIRLLVPSGSLLLELDDVRDLVGPFDDTSLVYPWRHPVAAVDGLQRAVQAVVARAATRPRRETFARICAITDAALGRSIVATRSVPPFAPGTVQARSRIHWLEEPWYC